MPRGEEMPDAEPARFYIAGGVERGTMKACGMLTLLTDICAMLAAAVLTCVGGVLLGAGFLLLKLAGLLLGILVGCRGLMEAAGDCFFRLIGA